ncbi:hypothetical protein HN011_003079 [Eciton burchellii]|nr:hypothetical protein HN011_003079 [Eciton burchellii]
MSYLSGTFLLICLYTGLVYADMDCSILGHKGIFDKLINSNYCPGYLDSSDKAYCCTNQDMSNIYCCDAEEFAIKTGLNIMPVILPVIITAIIVIGLIVCCISCLCCTCCPWYRRRHQGTVYGKVHTPVVQIIQPQTNLPPSYNSQPTQNQYVPSTIGMPQPPPYINEGYAKQAPYNPAYPPPQ